VVGPELDSTLRDILVDPGHPFDFAITFPGCMEFYTLDSLLNCCLVSLACGGWFGHEVFVDVVSRREVTDFSTSVSSPNVLDCMSNPLMHELLLFFGLWYRNMQGCGSAKRESNMQSLTSETEYSRKGSVRFVQDALLGSFYSSN